MSIDVIMPKSGLTASITPRAKKLAEEKRLAWAHIQGTGINGMITVEDLLAQGTPTAGKSEAAPAPVEVTPAPVETPAVPGGAVKMSQMQEAISRAMATSMATAAQTTLTAHADVSGLAATYRALKGRYAAAGVKLTYTAIIVKAVAHALENHPAARTMTTDGKTQWTMDRMHIGVAVDVPQGLIVPVIRDADRKGLIDICKELEDLARRAREQRLAESELGNAAMTVTNLGMFGVTYFTPILNLPESIILGVGTISDMPVARNGGLTIAPVLHLSLTHDHRVNNGAQLARFLAEVIASLNDFRWT